MNTFWKDALSRAGWTILQAFASVAVIGLSAGATVDWKTIGYASGVAALAALLSFLKTLAKDQLAPKS